MAKTNGDEILARLVDDLNKALPAAKSFFPEVDVNNPVRTKGRATKWAIHSLLADIYLWQGEYDKCIANCDSVIQSGRVGLIDGQYWFTNFNPETATNRFLRYSTTTTKVKPTTFSNGLKPTTSTSSRFCIQFVPQHGINWRQAGEWFILFAVNRENLEVHWFGPLSEFNCGKVGFDPE